MDQTFLSGAIPAAEALIGGLAGALATYMVSSQNYKLERTKLIRSLGKSVEVEKARIAAYVELWKRLGPISTYQSAEEIVANLPAAQAKLQEWYYDQGGGLLLLGAAENRTSAKAAFFSARDLHSKNPYEIWEVFHRLRRSIRRDLDVFESEADENAMLEEGKKRIKAYEN